MNIPVSSGPISINWNASGNDQIIQNVGMIFSTPAGTVPFYRDFGLNVNIDAPIGQAQAGIATEYVKKVKKYGAPAKIAKITFDDSQAINGQLTPTVVIGL